MADNTTNRNKRPDSLLAERRAAREAVLALLFESEYHGEESPESIFLRALDAREFPEKTAPIRREYEAIMENLPAIDELIGRHAKGWRTGRLSRVSRAILRLGTFELVYVEKIPAPIAINEAVELAKKYDDPKARAFINGVLNAIKDEIAAQPVKSAESDEA